MIKDMHQHASDVSKRRFLLAATTVVTGAAAGVLLLVSAQAFLAGDPARGAKTFQHCAACHLMKPGKHLTGPSVAHVWGRQAPITRSLGPAHRGWEGRAEG